MNSIGRGHDNAIPLKLKAISDDHCSIAYDPRKGWTISECGQARTSVNGTYVFLRTLKQLQDKTPSDLIPLHDGTVISFINYELRVCLQDKTPTEIDQQAQAAAAYFGRLAEHQQQE